MKQVLFFSIMAVLMFTFAACKNNKPATDETSVLSASEMENYNEFREFQEWKKQKEYVQQTQRSYAAKQYKPAAAVQKQVVYKTREAAPVATKNKKKGWSNAAKGAVIGGGAGAIAGGIISKRNRAAGAIIGGIIGGGAGYGIGRSIDKKNGR